MKLTYFGHSTFRISIPGASILFDPFITGNPAFPKNMSVEDAIADIDHVIVSHGHDDHVGDLIPVLEKTGATLTANYEICMWAKSRGIENINPMNSGGKVDMGAFSVALTQAIHSSATSQENEGDFCGTYLGNPHGVIVAANDEPVLYYMGDTDIFGDMALIDEIYKPEVGVVPIGDRFTMGPKLAAMACQRFFRFKSIVPCHYGTFPVLEQDADEFIELMGEDAFRVAPVKPGSLVELS